VRGASKFARSGDLHTGCKIVSSILRCYYFTLLSYG
jgi:hypothetical protein